MRRIALWFASTVSVVVLLFGYHTSTSGAGVAAGSPPAIVSTASTSSTSSTPTSSKASTSSSSKSSASAQATPTRSTTTTVTGDVAQTQWGPVQVSLTITGGRIASVAVPQYPNGNPRDAEINSYALPTLVQETVSAQSASIDMVSGATVTSTGYLQSLQSAIDKAGL